MLGLALLTKQSAVVFLPGFVLLVVLDCRGGRMEWRVGLRHVGLVLLVAGVIFGAWLAIHYKSPTADSMGGLRERNPDGGIPSQRLNARRKLARSV